ncbi:MAG: HesA/MoeB/ThiF family protein [Candidatus Rokuibacteriota bacterium]
MIGPLTDEQLRRYSRQLLLPDVGGTGQARLRAARVLIVGAGGLGSPAALYLAGAGVGVLGLVDGDAVELSNLQRQVLHGVKDLDRPKVYSGQARLGEMNPEVRVEPQHIMLTPDNAADALRGWDVVLEGSDNLATKLLVSDAAVPLGRPAVIGAATGWEGQLLVVRPGVSPCYRCVVRREPPAGSVPSCQEAGILGPVAGVIGCLQAVEALKLLLGLPTVGGLVVYDGRSATLETIDVRRNPACVCARSDG